jgi:hypothetical protein
MTDMSDILRSWLDRVVPILTALFRTCPAYSLFGLDLSSIEHYVAPHAVNVERLPFIWSEPTAHCPWPYGSLAWLREHGVLVNSSNFVAWKSLARNSAQIAEIPASFQRPILKGECDGSNHATPANKSGLCVLFGRTRERARK